MTHPRDGEQVTPIPKETRPWNCPKAIETCTRTLPCPSCRGRRNRRKGVVRQRQARKTIEAQTGTQAGRYSSQTGNEESWRMSVRVEAKAGRQVQRTATLYRLARAQSDAAHATGDTRPFVLVCVPDGWTAGTFLYVVHSDDALDFAETLCENVIEGDGGLA